MKFPRFAAFVSGCVLPLRALGLILRHPQLLAWSSLPFGLAVALLIWIFFQTYHRLSALLLPFLTPDPSHWNTWFLGTLFSILSPVVHVLLALLLLMVTTFCFSAIANLLALPFLDALAEATEPLTTPRLPTLPAPSLKNRLKAWGIDALKTSLVLVLHGLNLLWSLLPLVGWSAPIVTAYLLSFQFVSYPQTRRHQSLREILAFFVRNFWSCGGFGLSCSFLLSIPLLGVLCLPLAVVGGTLLFAQGELRSPEEEHSNSPSPHPANSTS